MTRHNVGTMPVHPTQPGVSTPIGAWTQNPDLTWTPTRPPSWLTPTLVKETLSGVGTPEGAVVAAVGALYTDTAGGAGTTLYVKESGTGSTGWVAK